MEIWYYGKWPLRWYLSQNMKKLKLFFKSEVVGSIFAQNFGWWTILIQNLTNSTDVG
jgi:hypothetical protein